MARKTTKTTKAKGTKAHDEEIATPVEAAETVGDATENAVDTILDDVPAEPVAMVEAPATATEPVTAGPVPAPTPEPSTPVGQSPEELADQLSAAIRTRDEVEAEKAAAMKAYGKRMVALDTQISTLASRYRDASCETILDDEHGVAIIRNRRTGEVLETRPLAPPSPQLPIPFGGKVEPPRAATDPLAGIEVGQVWQLGESHALIEIVAIADGSVVIRDDDSIRSTAEGCEIPTDRWTSIEFDRPKDLILPPDLEPGDAWSIASGDVRIVSCPWTISATCMVDVRYLSDGKVEPVRGLDFYLARRIPESEIEVEPESDAESEGEMAEEGEVL